MRFDLEISPITNSRLVYISEGKEINPSLCPLSYYSINTNNLFMEDFISSEEAFAVKEFSADGYEIKQGPSFEITSDKILITHVSKFSTKNGVEVPLFYKHIVYENISPDTIKIRDYFDIEIDKSEYIVEVYNNRTYIYMNKISDVLFIEYISNSRFKKSLIDLSPVFQEVTWESLAINGKITDFEYIINNSIIETTYTGRLYLSYINNIKLFKSPCGNIDDPWYIGILNSNFTVEKNNQVLRYTTPEFYRQKFDGGENLKLISNKKCRTIYPDIIKSQYQIDRSMYDSVYLYIKDSYTGNTKYAFTTNIALINTKYVDTIYYSKLENLSSDGFILLPISLSENDVAYITHYTKEEYCTYNKINLNSLTFNTNMYCAFYLIPNVIDTSSGIGHAFISGNIDTNYENFNSYNEYIEWINTNNYLHVSLVSLSYIPKDIVSTFDARKLGGQLVKKKEAYKEDIDAFYSEIISRDIILPTNDTLIAKLNTSRLIEENRFIKNVDGTITDITSTNFINKINDTLNKNLDISTKAILKID